MEKGKKSKKVVLYCIPFIVQAIVHTVATIVSRSEANVQLLTILAAAIVTAMSMLLGEGYGAFAFMVAGFYDRIVTHVFVVILSIVGLCASFIGYMMSGIEGYDCLWMTCVFILIDLFLIVFSIVRIIQLAAKKT